MQYDRIDVLIKDNNVKIGKGATPHEKQSLVGHIDGFMIHYFDHWLVCNIGFNFIPQYFNEGKSQIEIWTLKPRRFNQFAEINNYHFPLVKNSRAGFNDNAIKGAFSLDEIRQSLLVGTRIDPALLDKDKILAIYDSFDWDKANYEKA